MEPTGKGVLLLNKSKNRLVNVGSTLDLKDLGAFRVIIDFTRLALDELDFTMFPVT